MATANIEETINALERAGWRLQNLSHIRTGGKWSCILERKKLDKEGRAVFASALRPTPREALEAAWEAARGRETPSSGPALPPVVLPRLKIALAAARAALATSDDDDTS